MDSKYLALKLQKIAKAASLFFAAVFLSTLDVAAYSPEKTEKKSSLSGKVNLGYSKMSGNVEALSYQYASNIKWKLGRNLSIFKISGQYAEQEENAYDDQQRMSLLNVYSFNNFFGAYAKASNLKNKFIGYKYQRKLGAGCLFTLYDKDLTSFKSRVGYQRRFSEDINHNVSERSFLLIGARFDWPVMTNIIFKAEANYEAKYDDRDDYEHDGEASFIFTVNDLVNIKISHVYKYINIPVEGAEKTDRSFSTELVLKF